MVLRRDGRGVLAVGQASHAWLCGQLARAWGNARFGAVVPLAEVALGAEQHDVGMAEWDLQPARHPETGLPQSFIEMPVEVSLALWRAGPRRLITQSRYAALLAAMHGRRLYERRDLRDAPPADAAAVRDFLSVTRTLEAELLTALRADPATAAHVTDAAVERNRRLVWTWDTLSLALLLDWAPLTLRDVPTAGDGTIDIAMNVAGERGGSGRASLHPWPFAADEVRVRCDGRRLDGRFEDQAALDRALARAAWETAVFSLSPDAQLQRVGDQAPTI